MKHVALSNQVWITELEENHSNYLLRVGQLRDIILNSLSKAFRKHYRIDHNLLEDITHDSVMKILEKKETFRSESRFTSWAIKIAVNMVLSDLRKSRWNDVSFDDLDYESTLFNADSMHRFFDSPEKKALRSQLVEMVNSMMNEHLTEKQNQALKLIIRYEMPLDEVARQLGTNRNALYKLLHDGRKKLKIALENAGMDQSEVSSLIMIIFYVSFSSSGTSTIK